MAIEPYGSKEQSIIFRGSYEARNGIVLPLLPSDPADWPTTGIQDRATFYHQTESALIPYSWNEVLGEWQKVSGSDLTGSASISIVSGVVEFTGRYGTGNSNPGTRAVSMGQNNTAGGVNSVAFGEGNVLGSAAKNSFAAGYNNTVTNETSALFGSGNTSSAANTFIAGSNNKITLANSTYSIIFGSNNTHSGSIGNGTATFIYGLGNNTTGSYNFVAGHANSCASHYNVAIGYSNTVSGSHAKALGYGLTVKAWATIALGANNITPPTPYQTNSYDARDLALVIGVGSGTGDRANGLSMWKNGNVQLGRVVTPATPVDNGNALNVMGRISANLPEYASDATADADATLPSRSFYKLSGSRAVYQKP